MKLGLMGRFQLLLAVLIYACALARLPSSASLHGGNPETCAVQPSSVAEPPRYDNVGCRGAWS